jgi:hypothetical protein
MITHYTKVLHASTLGWALGGGVPWLWPTFATLHFFGMALLIGCIGAIDLRMLGVARGLPLKPMQRLRPLSVLGFAINLFTGIGLYAANPPQYQSFAFAAKMAFVALAGLNALLFYSSGMASRVNQVRAGHDVPLAAKLAAGISLALWIGVIYWGRMLPFFSNTF